MKHTIFDTRQRADELLHEAIEIWRQNDHNEQLEGLEKDPVFKLLMSAVAYQANEIDVEIERLKADVLEEFSSVLTPYEIGHATPASTVIQTMPAEGLSEVELNSDTIFTLSETDFPFTPVLHTRVLNITVSDVKRFDGRRWIVEFTTKAPINNLSHMTFVINNPGFRNLTITVGEKSLPVIRPWELSEMPMADIFVADAAIYNQTMSYDPSMTCLDLLARHNMRLFCIDTHKDGEFLSKNQSKLRMVFEFHGITDNFTFDKNQIIVNAVVLANATAESVSLDSTSPIARITDTPNSKSHAQLVHLLRPGNEQIFRKEPITVRRVMADRFNQGALTRLLSSLLCKLQSDYYAYQYINARQSLPSLNIMREQVQKLMMMSNQKDSNSINGTYLMLSPRSEASVMVRYVITSGAAVNDSFSEQSRFLLPESLSKRGTRQISAPVMGTDEVSTQAGATELVRYAIASNNRIVTPADIRIFCYTELLNRFGITRNMVRRIKISHNTLSGNTATHNACGYEIDVKITIIKSNFINQSFINRIPQTEIVLEKMMQVRSANIYPIKVTIEIE